MGNISSSCFSEPESRGTETHSIEFIENINKEEISDELINSLIKRLDDLLQKVKGNGKDVSSSSRVNDFAAATKFAPKVVELISKNVDKIPHMEISDKLTDEVTRLLKGIARTHYIFVGLSLVAHTLELYMKMRANESDCKKLLVELVDLAKEVKKFKEAVPDKDERVCNALREIGVGAVTCCNYLTPGRASRFWQAVGMESQLSKTKQAIQSLRSELTLAATIHVADGVNYMIRQTSKLSVPSPSDLLDFKPEGVEDQAKEVIEKLDIEGSEQIIAVSIVGLGGSGKSTLAASVIQSLNLPSKDFKFSMVKFDQKKSSDKTSEIVHLQRDIIFHLSEDRSNVQNAKDGREKLKEALDGKYCFLYLDNVVDISYIKMLLPTELLSQKPSVKMPESEKKSVEGFENQMQKTKIRILITSRQEDLNKLSDIKHHICHFDKLPDETAEKVLRGIILEGKKALEFEENKLTELAKVCNGVPLLWSVFGNHLKDNREERSYNSAIEALKNGNIDRFKPGYEESLSKTIMFVYDQMEDEEHKDAFLDICKYFHGRDWNQVADIVDSDTLAVLHKKKMVNKSKAGEVIVHDILLVMGANKAKDTRLMNYEEFYDVLDDESKLKQVKLLVLDDATFLATLETRHLNAMRHSLRVLVLGDWIRIDGPPCDRAFKKLRYLRVGDLKDFPFKDISKMEKLNYFWNGSKPGMNLAQVSPSLKVLTHQIPYRDCNEFQRLPLKKLKSLKELSVKTEGSVTLPQGFKLPGSLERLVLNSCEQLPETFGHLSALQTLELDKCDLKSLPQGFTQSAKLSSLSMQNCTNMISLPDNTFPSLSSLRELDLRGCIQLEKLPADICTLTALQFLNIRNCEALTLLPENFGELKTLKTLAIVGCIGLHRLPGSFRMLPLEHLTFKSLPNFKKLPRKIGDLICLKILILKSCHSLEFLPDSLVNLKNLNVLDVRDCINLSALPKDFHKLSSLEQLILSDCPLLKTLPDGFEGLKTLKCMGLVSCRTLQNLPASFEMLSSLEVLYLHLLPFSTLPDGLGKLKMLKILSIQSCWNFQKFPDDFENMETLESLHLRNCTKLEGATMDTVVKLQNCHFVNITKSTNLIEQWNEMEEENQNLGMIVKRSRNSDEHGKELLRALRVGLSRGKCIELDSNTNKSNHYDSISIPYNTTIAVISLQSDQPEHFKRIVDMATDRAKKKCEGNLRIFYVCRKSDDSDRINEEGEIEKILQALRMLQVPAPGNSYAIPSTDIRRLSLIGRAIFHNPNVFNHGTGPKILCSMVDVMEDDKGHQPFKDVQYVGDDMSEESLPAENSDEEIETSDGILQFICESRTQSFSEQNCRLPLKNVNGEFIQKLKNDNIYHFADNKGQVDDLQGKTVAIILIDQNYPECKRLQQIYEKIKSSHSDFEAIWIPLPEKKDFGFGTYSRAIQSMPWLCLADPKLIKIDDIKGKNPRVIIVNKGGNIENPNALSLLMSTGADAYPFTKRSLSEMDLKSSLEIVIHCTEIRELNNKLVFLYAEPPGENLRMKSSLENLVQKYGKGNFEIVYVGRLFTRRNIAESLQKTYENAIESMDWTKLSFEDMMRFWYRCKYILDEETNSESKLNGLLNALLDEERWLVVVDEDGIVTANGIDVVEMALELSDEKDDEVGLREGLKLGKCSERVRAIFCDELNHPLDDQHALRPQLREYNFYCDKCHLSLVYTPYGKRVYGCRDCNWDLCWDCWKEFVKGQVNVLDDSGGVVRRSS